MADVAAKEGVAEEEVAIAAENVAPYITDRNLVAFTRETWILAHDDTSGAVEDVLAMTCVVEIYTHKGARSKPVA